MTGMIMRCLIFAGVVALPLFANAQDPMKPLTIDNLMELKSVGNPTVSPDGNWVAYVVRSRDMKDDESNSQIWMVSTSGGEPIAMTAVDTSAGNPQWSPDNKYLSFTASKGEDAKSQVWNLNRLGGEATQITHLKQGANDFAWSPDGARLMVLASDPKPAELTDDEEDDEKPLPHVIDRMQFKQDYVGYLDRRRTHIYIVTPGDKEAVQVTFGEYDDAEPVWAPNSQSIAFVSDRSDDPDLSYGSDIFVVDLTDKNYALSQVTANPGRDFSPAWSPDGRNIAYVTSTGPDVGGSALTPTKHLATTALGADERNILTPNLDRNVSNPQYSSNGEQIVFELQESGRDIFAAVGAGGGGVEPMLERQGSVRDVVMDGGKTVISLSLPDQPTELYSYNNGELQRLTFVTDEALADVARADVEKLQFSSADGTPVEAFLVRPLNFNEDSRYPTILWLHGGLAAQFTFGYSEIAQLYAANGYAVIMPNPRGSTGYGSEFAHGTVAEWGKNDYADVMAAIDYGIEIGVVDESRLGVGGWSYGGILTNYVITQTQRFHAAMSGASLGLVTANYGHDHYQLMYELEFGLPWEFPERWIELSPFNKVEQITTPTLWMGGALDWNVPIINSEQMYIAMKRLGRETQLVVYPDEHHGIRRPSFQKDRLERWLAWYGQYLNPESMASAATR